MDCPSGCELNPRESEFIREGVTHPVRMYRLSIASQMEVERHLDPSRGSAMSQRS